MPAVKLRMSEPVDASATGALYAHRPLAVSRQGRTDTAVRWYAHKPAVGHGRRNRRSFAGSFPTEATFWRDESARGIDMLTSACMSACLQRFQWRSQRADPRGLHEPGRSSRKGMGRAGQGCRSRVSAGRLDGRHGGSACGTGKTARRRGSNCPTVFWPTCPASMLGSRRPGLMSVLRTGPVVPPTSAAGWNTDEMP